MHIATPDPDLASAGRARRMADALLSYSEHRLHARTARLLGDGHSAKLSRAEADADLHPFPELARSFREPSVGPHGAGRARSLPIAGEVD